MNNEQIRAVMHDNNIYMWQVAKKLNVYETSFCKWFREELSEERKQQVLSAIEDQPQQQVGLNGKVVQAVEQITANDVPMDGSVAVFPKQDMSEIYTKSWNADGTIRTIVYKPYTASQPGVANSSADMSKMKMGLSDEATEAFMARFDSLEKKFDELMPKIVSKRPGGLKKEANENE